MNTQLTEQLKAANDTCNYAFENYFSHGEGMKVTAEMNYYRHKGWAKAASWAIGFIAYFIGFAAADGEDIAIGLSIAFAIAGGIMAYYLLLLPKVKEKYNDAVKDAEGVNALGFQYLNEHISDMNIIPSEYWFPKATGYLYNLAATGRVETVNQALAMLDDQLHRWKVEGSYSRIIDEQEKQGKTLKRISIETALNTFINATRH